MNKKEIVRKNKKRVYQGYELIQAIKENKIEPNTKLIIKTYWNGNLYFEKICKVLYKDLQYEDGHTVNSWGLINSIFIIEDEEINIQNIEELETLEDEYKDDKTVIINKLVQAVKYLDNKIKEMK